MPRVRLAEWIRHTQFSGNHPYCDEHARKEKNFGKEDPSYFFWEKIEPKPMPEDRVEPALRRYQVVSQRLLGRRYRDGECDAVALHEFAQECQEIDEYLAGERETLEET